MLKGKRLLLIVSGGIAAYKCLELIRRLKERGMSVRCILTKAGAEFVTPLSLSALTEEKVYQELFSLTDEAEMGHIRLSREADLVLVAPATADLMARMAAGMANDLATTALLATDKPVMVAPAMNVFMWTHAATQANLETLRSRGIVQVGPNAGDLACGEVGSGRMAEPMQILAAIESFFASQGEQPLAGKKAVVTSGPTHEPIDPVRYIANRSSGKQGHAIAKALAAAGAEVTLISGPVSLPDPANISVIHVETARQMHTATLDALPTDILVCAAAVADWRVADAGSAKIKKQPGQNAPSFTMVENPDILAGISKGTDGPRPKLVVGFAAETGKAAEKARAKIARKGCDWILANDVSEGTTTFGGSSNQIHFMTANGREEVWPELSKDEVGTRLTQQIAAFFAKDELK